MIKKNLRAEDIAKIATAPSSVESDLCFVIMSFSNNPVLLDFYECVIKPTVEGLGFRCLRVDEEEFNGSVTNKILENIRTSRFIIFDATEARPNCYYELGIAHALNKDVIHITNNPQNIHFDIKDYNFIVYQRQQDLSEKLKNRVLSTIK